MGRDSVVELQKRVQAESPTALDDILRVGARRMLQAAVEEEVSEYVEQHPHLTDPQIEIADELGIGHPTVSQHLNGKRRDGKKVGGATRKIRKTIRREASTFLLRPMPVTCMGGAWTPSAVQQTGPGPRQAWPR